jgi:hypothetical protein
MIAHVSNTVKDVSSAAPEVSLAVVVADVINVDLGKSHGSVLSSRFQLTTWIASGSSVSMAADHVTEGVVGRSVRLNFSWSKSVLPRQFSVVCRNEEEVSLDALPLISEGRRPEADPEIVVVEAIPVGYTRNFDVYAVLSNISWRMQSTFQGTQSEDGFDLRPGYDT